MKKILSVIAFLAFIPVFAQTNSPVTFKEMKPSFGKIPQNVPATYEFSFTNTSDKPVVIETATASCGCTKPEYDERPIAKGKTSTIKVTYNAANTGNFTKNVTVKFANVAEAVILTIDGEVIKKD